MFCNSFHHPRKAGIFKSITNILKLKTKRFDIDYKTPPTRLILSLHLTSFSEKLGQQRLGIEKRVGTPRHSTASKDTTHH